MSIKEEIENGEESSLGVVLSSEEDNENDADIVGGASSSVGNGSGIMGMEDSDLSDEDDVDAPQVDRYGFMGGKQFSQDDPGVPINLLRKREMKWLDMIDDWEKWMTKKPKKVRERCRKGIPSSIRSRAWQYLCGSKKLYEQNKERFKELDEMEGDPKWIDIIERDLDRQFPFHEIFAKKGGSGQQDLFRILKAYSIYNPRDGYCQGQAPVAAVLLMHMPAEEAFWCLVQICERYLTGYYSPGLEAVQIDGEVLFGLMKKVLPPTFKHMRNHRIEPILYMTEWFMCIFARTLPWASVLRVWDMFFFEGVKILFRVALVLLKHTLGSSQQLSECPGLYETMEKLKHIPDEIVQEEFLVSEMLKLKVFEKDLEAEHSLSLARRKAIKQRQLSSEKAKAMARDIEVKKKTSKSNPAKEWAKEKKRKEKQRSIQNDTDSALSVPNAVINGDDADATSAAGQIGNGLRGSGKDEKKKKKKDKSKKKEKLTVDIATATDSKWSSTELNSPDIEKEFEVIDRLSSSSGSPAKAWNKRREAYTDRENMSEETIDIIHSSGKKKKKEKKKKSNKGKDKETISIGERTDDDLSVMMAQGSIESKDEKKGKKKKSKNKDKDKQVSERQTSVEDRLDVITTGSVKVRNDGGSIEGNGSKKIEKKMKDNDMENENNLPGMIVSSGSDKHLEDEKALKQSFTGNDKKRVIKDKKEYKRKDSGRNSESPTKGNGKIPSESTSDGYVSSPVNLSDYEVIERQHAPDSDKLRGSQKRMGLIYSDEDLQNKWKDFGPIPEIPSFEEIREKRLSKEREHEERKRRLAAESQSKVSGSVEIPDSDTKTVGKSIHSSGNICNASGTTTKTVGTLSHSLSNGMDPGSGLSQQGISNGNSQDKAAATRSKLQQMRDFRSFDYGTTV